MDLRDLIVTPLLILILYTVALYVRPFVTDSVTKKYFLPALTIRIIGALSLGIIYQFYYGGGDTFNFHTHGSRNIWNALMDSPEVAWRLFFNDGYDYQGILQYAEKIIFFQDPSAYAVVRLAFIFDIFTFSTYSATAILFCVFGFTGMWMFFQTFYNMYPHLHRQLAIGAFFIPSVFFWGSGLMKDTITLGCLGVAVFQIYKIFQVRKFGVGNVVLLAITLYGLYIIKVYILMVFLPTAIIWVFLSTLDRIRRMAVKVLLFPIVLSVSFSLAYMSVRLAGEGNDKYSLDKISKTAQITAYDIRYWTGRDAGSGYTLGKLDGSFSSMVNLAPNAINASLFRPYLWEVNNVLMLMAAIESFAFFLFVVIVLARVGFFFAKVIIQPNVIFLISFAITFAFAVGVSTFNFGTLVRYKIPMLPFFFVGLVLMMDHAKSSKNAE